MAYNYNLTLSPAQTGLAFNVKLAKREQGSKLGPRVAASYVGAPDDIIGTTMVNGFDKTGKLTSKEQQQLNVWVHANRPAIMEHWFGTKFFLAQNAPGKPLHQPAQGLKPGSVVKPQELVTLVGFSRDHSGSMGMITSAAMRDYNSQLTAIKNSIREEGQQGTITVLRCGVGWNGRIEREIVNERIEHAEPISRYLADGASTPLFDSVGQLIELMLDSPKAKDPNASFLVMVVTDGHENNRTPVWSASRLAAKMRELQATDRWTFTFRVPRGYAKALADKLGVPIGNVLEWDQTDRGMEASAQATHASISQFFKGRTAGQRGSKAFYTNVANVSKAQVAQSMADITSIVRVHTTMEPIDVSAFSNKYLGRQIEPGTLFYQLTKREPKVQDYKIICIRDRNQGTVYGGDAARDILGLPKSGTHPVIPGVHGDWDIFIQSTSLNRKLPQGTQVMYWPGANRV